MKLDKFSSYLLSPGNQNCKPGSQSENCFCILCFLILTIDFPETFDIGSDQPLASSSIVFGFLLFFVWFNSVWFGLVFTLLNCLGSKYKQECLLPYPAVQVLWLLLEALVQMPDLKDVDMAWRRLPLIVNIFMKVPPQRDSRCPFEARHICYFYRLLLSEEFYHLIIYDHFYYLALLISLLFFLWWRFYIWKDIAPTPPHCWMTVLKSNRQVTVWLHLSNWLKLEKWLKDITR